MKTALIVILLAGCLGLGYAWYQENTKHGETTKSLNGELFALKDKNAALEKDLKKLRSDLAALKAASGKPEIARLTEENEKLKAEIAKAKSAEVAAVEKAKEEGKKKPLAGMGDMLKKMMDDPEKRAFLRTQQETVLRSFYKDLFESLGLDKETEDKLFKIIMDRQMTNMEMGAGMINADDKEGQKAAAEAIAKKHKEYNLAIKELLGDEAHDTFKRYEGSVAERQQLSTLRGKLDSAKLSMSPEQEQKLMDIMYEEKKSNDNAAKDVKTPPGEDWVEKTIALEEAKNKRILDRANGLLDQEQIRVLEQVQSDAVKNLRIQMKFVKDMGIDPEAAAKADPNRN